MSTRGPRRARPSDRYGPGRHVALPHAIDEAIDAAAARLHLTRSVVLRESVIRGHRAAIAALERELAEAAGDGGGEA